MRLPFQASCKLKHESLLIVGLMKLNPAEATQRIEAHPSPAALDGEVCRVEMAQLLDSLCVSVPWTALQFSLGQLEIFHTIHSFLEKQ